MADLDGFYLGGIPTAFSARIEHRLLSGLFLRPAGQFVPTYFTRRSDVQQRLQYAPDEVLQISFPPFLNAWTGAVYPGTDAVTLTIKRPDGTLLIPPPSPVYDVDVHLWLAEISTSAYIPGRWMIRASSDSEGAVDQNLNLSWGGSAVAPSVDAIRNAILDDQLAGHASAGSVGDGIAISAGLLQGNFMMDNVVNTDPNGQTAVRLRIWRDASSMASATAGDPGVQGAFAVFDVETTYTGPGRIAMHKVVRSL